VSRICVIASLAAAVLLAAAGCASKTAIASPSSGSQPAGAAPSAAVSCHVRGQLPDSRCTPGAIDPAVTQANIHQTICVPGYTATVRPPDSYTGALKRSQLRAYGDYAGASLSGYEEDHLISLEIGGSPRSALNLWPEAHPASYTKDGTENVLRAAVCSGKVTLAAAQHAIATDWATAEKVLGLIP
jgi:hypothetical protein